MTVLVLSREYEAGDRPSRRRDVRRRQAMGRLRGTLRIGAAPQTREGIAARRAAKAGLTFVGRKPTVKS